MDASFTSLPDSTATHAPSGQRLYLLKLLALLGCAGLALGLALTSGSVPVTLHDLWQTDSGNVSQQVLFTLRLPRALTCYAIGALLALSGLLMQVLLRNPLADPYVLGTSGGAAVGALTAMLLGMASWWVPGAATLGAFLSIVLVFALAHAEGSWSATRLLLCGVVLSAGASALVSLLLTLGDESQLRGMLFWLMGDITQINRVLPLWSGLLAAGLLCWFIARHLNLLARGDTQAAALGLNVRRARISLFTLSAVLTAATVTTAGSIGFIGLITPHLSRLWVGADHRRLVPVVILLGGALLTLADTAARTWFAPRLLPVGALTALVGVPLFLMLLLKRRAHV